MKQLLEYIDPFFEKQPTLEFVKELEQPIHVFPPQRWNVRKANGGEVSFVDGAVLIRDFDDPKGLLQTAYDDFELFMSVHEIAGGKYPIRTVYTQTDCFEAYRIHATAEGCEIAAADTEGIRRGLIYLEDEMLRREGAFLPTEPIERQPFVKSRITRCFFSPTNRPPKNGEELGDDVDYYPEEYLNRLAHDGVNGVWIYTHFRDLLPSKIIPEYGQNYKRRMDKLNRTIEKCARYGIRVYVLGVEPASTYRNETLLTHHKELLGNKLNEEWYTFCTGTEKGIAYAEESTRTLFTLAPDLAGLIVISVGESVSGCASIEKSAINCPHCKDKDPHQVLADTVAALERGMHAVKPEAELISWPYGQRGWGRDEVIKSASYVPENTILMHNFEDLGETEQLGKTRLAVDYWLSYAGPSEMFEKSAIAAKKIGRRMYAKLQVCCSHEVASIPYVPVPGILYKKYKAMRELGVDGAVQCWYFGNYPSIMGKAAGELSFEPYFKDEESFLRHLAGIYWGSETESVVQAWRSFEQGYENTPVNLAFGWYGPMHDAPVWPLQLLPKNRPLAASWLTQDAVGGDRIGECLCCGHDIHEAVTLTSLMTEHWSKGIGILGNMPVGSNEPWKAEQISLAKALNCQFESGRNAFRFYELREMLGLKRGNATSVLDEMESIVQREMDISRTLKTLCEADPRLGYHSEGEGYKYFPAKLDWRIDLLEKLLTEEFPIVRERIAQGLAPLEFYEGAKGGDKQYQCRETQIDNAQWEEFLNGDGTPDDTTRWRASMDDNKLVMQIHCMDLAEDDRLELWTEFQLMWPYPPLYMDRQGKFGFSDYTSYYSLSDQKRAEEKAKWNFSMESQGEERIYTVSIDRKHMDMEAEIRPFLVDLIRHGKKESSWIHTDYYASRLIFGSHHPEQFGWVMPKA